MLRWVHHAQAALAVPHGIVRAHQVQCLNDATHILSQAQHSAAEQLQQATHQAEACLAEAREQAQALRNAAIADIEAARQKGYEAGWAQSCEQWHTQQMQQQHALQSLHAQMATIVTAAVERMVHSADREAVYRRALQSVQTVARDVTTLTMRVSPQDEQVARQALALTPPDTLADAVNVDIQVDNSLPADSCIVESPQGWLDASLRTQLSGLRAAMERAVRHALNDDAEGLAHADG